MGYLFFCVVRELILPQTVKHDEQVAFHCLRELPLFLRGERVDLPQTVKHDGQVAFHCLRGLPLFLRGERVDIASDSKA